MGTIARRAALLLLVMLSVAGCGGTNRGSIAQDYYVYRLPQARASVRAAAMGDKDKDTVLSNVRLGMASLADGDIREANESLGLVYKLMESGKVNTQSRIVAATIISDGIAIWKGEPFEQAMAYYAYAVSRALDGDWENARASIRGALGKLRDFSKAKKGKQDLTSEDLAKLSAEAEQAGNKDFLRTGGLLVESDFVLGYLLQGIAEQQIGASGKGLESALQLRPHLKPLVDTIRSGNYNALLIVDYGRGPYKYRYGRDNVYTDWRASEVRTAVDLDLSVNGKGIDAFRRPVHDMLSMAANHRWKNLENARNAKSILGTAMLAGGAATAALATNRDTAAAGAAIAVAGLLLKASAGADIRHNELLPNTTFIAPILLPDSEGRAQSLRVGIPDDPTSTFVVPRVRPGSSKQPTVIYLRLFRSSRPPAYFTSTGLQYRNDHVLPRKGDYPYILGGRCVAQPSPAVLRTYKAGGYLKGLSLDDLIELYRQEGIQFHTGPNAKGKWTNLSFLHVLEGGNVLYTPNPYTVGYKRIMYAPKRTYVPKSRRVREIADRIRERNEAKQAP